jgi:hypothetical protein
VYLPTVMPRSFEYARRPAVGSHARSMVASVRAIAVRMTSVPVNMPSPSR